MAVKLLAAGDRPQDEAIGVSVSTFTAIFPLAAGSRRLTTNSAISTPPDSVHVYTASAHRCRFGVPFSADRACQIALTFTAGNTINGLTVRVADLAVFKSWGLDNKPAMIFGINAMQGLRVIYDHQAKRFWFDHSRCKAPA